MKNGRSKPDIDTQAINLPPTPHSAPGRTAADLSYKSGAFGFCRGCGVDLPAPSGRPPRRPRLWCSENCRVRTGYREGRHSKNYAPRSAVFVGNCSECGTIFVSPLKGQRPKACPDHVLERKARLAREKYSAHREAATARMRKLRAERTPEQRRRDAIRRAVGRIESTVAAEQRRRARLQGNRVESFKPVEVFARDGWVCQICFEPIDRALRYPDPFSKSLDHVVQIQHGGEHSMANTRASHLVCNVRRPRSELAA